MGCSGISHSILQSVALSLSQEGCPGARKGGKWGVQAQEGSLPCCHTLTHSISRGNRTRGIRETEPAGGIETSTIYHNELTVVIARQAGQAMGKGRKTILHAFVREIVFYIPMMFLLDKLFGETGLAAALPAGETCGAIFALFLLHRAIHEKKGERSPL